MICSCCMNLNWLLRSIWIGIWVCISFGICMIIFCGWMGRIIMCLVGRIGILIRVSFLMLFRWWWCRIWLLRIICCCIIVRLWWIWVWMVCGGSGLIVGLLRRIGMVLCCVIIWWWFDWLILLSWRNFVLR